MGEPHRRCYPGPVVALHGFADSGACWQPFLDRLALRDVDVHTPNLLGHGGRTMPAGVPFSHDELVADASASVERVVERSGRRAVLLGHSLGATTAAGVAATAPHLVRLLVLEDPPWGEPAAQEEQDAHANRHHEWLVGLQGTDHAGRLGWVGAENPGWPRAELDPWARAKAEVDLALFEAPQDWVRRRWPAVASGVRCPTLLLVGEPGRGSACDPDVAEALAERWLVLRVTGAGHNVRRDAPTLVATLLRGLLGVYGSD